MIRYSFLLTLVASTSLFGAWSQSSAPTQQPNLKNTTPHPQNVTVMEIIEAGRDFTTASQALQSVELSQTLQNPGPYTLFLPNNTAFQDLPEGNLKKLLQADNRDHLKQILMYHIIRGKMMPNDLKPGRYKTMNGKEITITEENGQKKINGAKITKSSALGKNGVIYVIDTVLMP